VPTVLQLEALECGAACLAMVLAHHGRWMPLVALRRLCGVSRDGSRASAMVRAARELGLEADGFRMDVDGLRSVPKPAILFVNGGHFVVLEGHRRGGAVQVNDPAGGRMRYTAEEFAAIYSGIVLTFRPGPGFTRGGHPPRIVGPLLARLSGARATFLLLLSAGAALILPGIVAPSFTRTFIDQYVVDQQGDVVPWLVTAMIGTVLVQAGLTRIQSWARLALRNRIGIGAATAFMRRVLRMPVGFFAQRSAASIGARLDLAERLADHAGAQLPGLIVAAAGAILFAALMPLYSPQLAAVSFAITAATVLATLLLQRRLAELERKASLDGLKLGTRTMQGMEMLETIKAGGAEDRFLEAWTGQQALAANHQQRIGRLMALAAVLAEALAAAGNMAALTLGGLLVMRGELTLGLLLAYLILQAAFFVPVRGLLSGLAALGRARATLDQFDDIEAVPLAGEFSGEASAAGKERPASPLGRIRKLEGRIELRDVTFGYALLAPPLVSGLSLRVEPGSSVALVGASGSGKSTVGRLVAGLHGAWSGQVMLDGVLVGDISRTLLRNSLAVVDQDIAMFSGTVRDNITLWDHSIPEDRVVRSAKDAAIHADILLRPQGYDSAVEEDGRNFSGGQRQRLEIARALVTDPSILILDEATSALDPAVEKTVSDNLRRRGCTCLIIAHRLSTIRDCDDILVMDGGRIVQRGTHEALMAAEGGPYRRLVETAPGDEGRNGHAA